MAKKPATAEDIFRSLEQLSLSESLKLKNLCVDRLNRCDRTNETAYYADRVTVLLESVMINCMYKPGTFMHELDSTRKQNAKKVDALVAEVERHHSSRPGRPREKTKYEMYREVNESRKRGGRNFGKSIRMACEDVGLSWEQYKSARKVLTNEKIKKGQKS